MDQAELFERVDKTTEVFVRFSAVGGEKRSGDTERDPRGFAMKFYTGEGNRDMVGNNTPMFFVCDPLKFSDLIYAETRSANEPEIADHDMRLLEFIAGIHSPSDNSVI